jgi:hypothetical protein
MTRILGRRWIALASVVVVLFIGDIFAAPIVVDTKPECERAADWVVAHRGSLPTTLEGLSAFPPSYRRAIADALPPATIAELWRTNTINLANRSTNSPAQREATLEMARLISPVLYDRNPEFDAARLNLREDLTARLIAAYPDQNDRVAFGNLGPSEPSFSLNRGGLIQLGQGVRNMFTANAGRLLNCNCSTWFDCAQTAISCNYGNCTQVYQCGPFGGIRCDGRCVYPS